MHPGTDLGGSLRRPDEATRSTGSTGTDRPRVNAKQARRAGPNDRGEVPLIHAPLDDPSGGRGQAAAIPHSAPTVQRRRPERDHGLTVLAAPPNARARALLAAQETDRRRIARDLHDVVGGALTAVKLSLEAAARRPDVRSTRTSICETVNVLDQAIQAVRQAVPRPASVDPRRPGSGAGRPVVPRPGSPALGLPGVVARRAEPAATRSRARVGLFQDRPGGPRERCGARTGEPYSNSRSASTRIVLS